MSWLLRSAALLLAMIAAPVGLYALAVAVGAVWTTPAGPGTPVRTIHVVATPIHAEVVIPLVDDVADWRSLVHTGAFPGDTAERDWLADTATHAAFGWGAESFYRNVRLLSDIRLAYVLDGLWDESLVHVTFMGDPRAMTAAVAISLSEEGYRTLVSELRAAFATQQGEVLPVTGASYTGYDGFFRGVGTYSPLVTCNEWVAARLRSAGVAVGRFTPFSQTLRFSLPRPPQVAE